MRFVPERAFADGHNVKKIDRNQVDTASDAIRIPWLR